MKSAIENLQIALRRGEAIRPKVGGFPYLAECLRRAGAKRNRWSLPSCQSIFITDSGTVAIQGQPLVSGFVDVPPYCEPSLIAALRADQAGETSFPEFLAASWKAGVVAYDVDFVARKVSYFGAHGECYVEAYAEVTLPS